MQRESQAGFGLAPCSALSADSPKLLAFLREAPGVSYPAGLALLRHFRGRRLCELVRASDGDMASALPWFSDHHRAQLRHFFSRPFEQDGFA